jgi:nicotinic acid mononucleotide adenylyltransferase
MARLAFTGLEPGVEIDFTDFDRSEGRRAFERQAQYEEQGEVWHVVGYDLVAGGRNGTSEIQKKWMHGVRIWAQFNWVVMQRPCAPFMKEDLPPNHLLLPAVPVERSSTQVRERVAQGLSIADFVSPLVAAYIERNSLYCRSVN